MKWLPMDQAPRDGSPIIVEHRPKLYSNSQSWQPTPSTVIQEAFFYSGRWQPWSGDPRTQSTATLEPLHWVFAHELRAALED